MISQSNNYSSNLTYAFRSFAERIPLLSVFSTYSYSHSIVSPTQSLPVSSKPNNVLPKKPNSFLGRPLCPRLTVSSKVNEKSEKRTTSP